MTGVLAPATTLAGIVSPPKVEALFWDGSTLWVGTKSGLFRWERGMAQPVRAYNNRIKIKSLFGSGSSLWIGTEKGLYHWSKQLGTEPVQIVLHDKLDKEYIWALHVTDKRIYIGTDSGLYRADRKPAASSELINLH